MENENEEKKEEQVIIPKRFIHQHKIETVFIDEYYGKIRGGKFNLYLGTRRSIPPTGGSFEEMPDKTYKPINEHPDDYQVALQICLIFDIDMGKQLINFLNHKINEIEGGHRH